MKAEAVAHHTRVQLRVFVGAGVQLPVCIGTGVQLSVYVGTGVHAPGVSSTSVQVSSVSDSRFHLKLPAMVITESQAIGKTNEMTRRDPMLTELDDSMVMA